MIPFCSQRNLAGANFYIISSLLLVSPDGRSYKILAMDKSIAAAWECGKMSLQNHQEMLKIHFHEK
jgi:hypothetical protein